MADALDAIHRQWLVARPDLADRMWSMDLVGRVQRLARVLERELGTFFAEHGLQNWESDVLFTLRRAAGPLTAGGLLRASMVTSGAITNRIDRLEQRGLVERVRDTEDRRSVLIQLTPQGRQLIDELHEAHLANEARLFQALPTEQREQLSLGLRTLLESLGDTGLS